MRFLHGRVKANKGGTIKVTTTKPTRILIMSEREFKRYKNNISFTYYGGQKDGEFEFPVPKSDIWNVVVEKGSFAKPINLTANIEVTKGVAKIHAVPKSLATSFEQADEILDKEHESDEE
jgi:hypothetical protein